VGAVLGISVLIAILGTSEGLHTFHKSYALMAIASATAGAVGLALGRVRARVPEEMLAPAESVP
jgi:hypothetical protein